MKLNGKRETEEKERRNNTSLWFQRVWAATAATATRNHMKMATFIMEIQLEWLHAYVMIYRFLCLSRSFDSNHHYSQ